MALFGKGKKKKEIAMHIPPLPEQKNLSHMPKPPKPPEMATPPQPKKSQEMAPLTLPNVSERHKDDLEISTPQKGPVFPDIPKLELPEMIFR